jgi:hypothetical protein
MNQHHDPIHSYYDGEAQLKQDQAFDRQFKQDMADAKAAAEAEWNLETTQSRRATWNGLVKEWAAAHKGQKMAAAEVVALQDRAGFTLEALKRHVTRHGL